MKEGGRKKYKLFFIKWHVLLDILVSYTPGVVTLENAEKFVSEDHAGYLHLQ